MPVTRRALIIAHEPDGPGGQVAIRLRERDYEVITHVVTHDTSNPNGSVPFPDLAPFDVVAIMGSIRSLTSKHEISSWVHDELDEIRAARDRDQPVLGICFGGQLIAEALGGSVEQSHATEIGWFEIEAPVGAINPVGRGPWMEWHHDRFLPPPEAEILATTADAVQLFTVGRMVGTQFHPEVDVAHIEDWLAFVDQSYLAEHGQHPEAILAAMQQHESRNIEQCHALVDWFLDSVAFPSDDQDTSSVEAAR